MELQDLDLVLGEQLNRRQFDEVPHHEESSSFCHHDQGIASAEHNQESATYGCKGDCLCNDAFKAAVVG
jgi:hypothetical protein